MKLSSYHTNHSFIYNTPENTEDNFRLLVESVKDYAIFMLDAAGHVSTWNAGAEKIKGYAANEIIGTHISIFYTNEDVARGEPENNLRHAAKEGNFQTEGLRVRKDGTLFWANIVYTALFGEHGELKGFAKVTRDITKQKEFEEIQHRHVKVSQQKLDESLKELSGYKYALDESSIVAITDANGIIKHANKNFCRQSKYSAAELIGKDHRIVNSGYHSKEFFRDLWATISKGEIWRGELRNKAKDGSYYWVYTTIVPFLNEQGKPYQYVAIRYNITERKKAEEKQHKLEEKLKAQTDELYGVFERILDGFIMLDKDFRYTFANKKIGLMVGCEPSSLIGKNVWEQFPDAVGSATYFAFQTAMADQRYVTNIDYYPPLNLWQENHIYPSANGLSVFIRDISVQKKAEQLLQRSEAKFRRIFESNMVGFMFWDAAGEILEANDRFLELIDYTREDLKQGKISWKELTPAEYTDNDIKALAYIRIKGTTEPREKEFIRKDGSRIAVVIGATILNESNPKQGVAYVMDITEQKETKNKILLLNEELEDRVKQRTEQLQMVNNELEAFSYSISHDLRAPLRAINGYAKILEEDYLTALDNEGGRLLKIIQQNAKKMGVLIDDLLAFSRLGRKEVNKSVINMNALVKNVVCEIEKNTQYKADIQIEKLHQVMADYSLMIQVITNLISNAVKYSSKKEKPVIIISSFKNKNGVVYSVSDNGAGFEMEYVHKLFGVFQRLHGAEAFEGSGVGLAIVQRIITRHGGKVWAKGELDKGATFYFSLPAK